MFVALVLAHNHHYIAHAFMLPQYGLNFAQLDAIAAHLNLVIDPAEKLQFAARPASYQIASLVKLFPDPLRNGSLINFAAVNSG